MIKQYCWLLLGMWFCAATTQAQEKRPALDPWGYPWVSDVAENLKKSYAQGCPSCFAKLEKRDEGWVVVVADVERQDSVIDRGLYWSKNKKSYNKQFDIKGLKRGEASDRRLYVYFDDRSDFVPLHGWAHWEDSIIARYERKAPKSPNDWEAWGRAYRARVFARLGMEWRSSAKATQEDPYLLGADSLALVQRDVDQWLKIYEELKNRYPSKDQYRSFVGDMATKWSCEIMDAVLMLWVVQGERAARPYLRSGLFKGVEGDMARNYLRSCPPNAVLVSWGDVPLYGMLYLQLSEGLRTDVTVVDASIIQYPLYYQWLIRSREGLRSLQMRQLPFAFDWLYITPPSDGDKTLSSKELMKALGAVQLPQSGRIAMSHLEWACSDLEQTNAVSFRLRGQNILLTRGQAHLLAIWQGAIEAGRPFLSLDTQWEEAIFGTQLSPWRLPAGLLNLYSYPLPDAQVYAQRVRTTILDSMKVPQFDRQTEQAYLYQFWRAHYRSIEYLVEAGDTNAAKRVFRQMESSCGVEIYLSVLNINWLLQWGEREAAVAWAKKVVARWSDKRSAVDTRTYLREVLAHYAETYEEPRLKNLIKP